MTRLLLTVPEAAEALAISRSKLYQLLASGAIASIRIADDLGNSPVSIAEIPHLIERSASRLC